jgi:hypothetical protein
MYKNLFNTGLSTSLLFLFCLLIVPASWAGEDLAQQTNREGKVTVKVTPLDLAAASVQWRFEIAFDTHVTALDHDLLAIAALDGGNGESAPIAWEGDAPGGHHRKGILTFKPLQPAPAAVTLKIRQVGGVAERHFNWPVVAP